MRGLDPATGASSALASCAKIFKYIPPHRCLRAMESSTAWDMQQLPAVAYAIGLIKTSSISHVDKFTNNRTQTPRASKPSRIVFGLFHVHSRTYGALNAPRSNAISARSSAADPWILIINHGTPVRTFSMGLQLLQSQLDHEKFLDEARDQVRQLGEEVDRLQEERALQPSAVSSSPNPASKWWPW
ncbi:uncharacterized protein HD556DRAFT_1309943 [Suillus plorans]|uniref:Uncharacterized protein n=1 Tax=Suillus plorans TaxID=116603 RepID=A0A9P7AKH4_9AGAM|nr:uncharacterized protein HD556DRAFT_1309943 [Suillus plorans]KAG1791357.1 hypothetical protein HD556DRAFT_1309943 [Suillus plorans]